jgi:hypothetical protein
MRTAIIPMDDTALAESIFKTGYVNLKGTDKRQNGDELLIEMILRMPSTVKDAPEQIFTLEQREFTMQLIKIFSIKYIALTILILKYHKSISCWFILKMSRL